MSFREKNHRVTLVTLPMAFGSHPPAEPGRIGAPPSPLGGASDR